MKHILTFLFILTLVTGFSLQSQATLTTIGQAQYSGHNYNLIWDNNSPFGSIVWLDYTNDYNSWQNQMNWASGLNSGGALTYNINPSYNVTWSGDWRLPSTVDGPAVWGYNGSTTSGYNITTSEMGHLYYTELGNKGYYATNGTVPQPGWGLTNKDDFQNLMHDSYWSGTLYSANTACNWKFTFIDGSQGYDCRGIIVMGGLNKAIAVRTSEVTVVPEPISSTLFVAGGVLLAGRRFLRMNERGHR